MSTDVRISELNTIIAERERQIHDLSANVWELGKLVDDLRAALAKAESEPNRDGRTNPDGSMMTVVDYPSPNVRTAQEAFDIGGTTALYDRVRDGSVDPDSACYVMDTFYNRFPQVAKDRLWRFIIFLLHSSD